MTETMIDDRWAEHGIDAGTTRTPRRPVGGFRDVQPEHRSGFVGHGRGEGLQAAEHDGGTVRAELPVGAAAGHDLQDRGREGAGRDCRPRQVAGWGVADPDVGLGGPVGHVAVGDSEWSQRGGRAWAVGAGWNQWRVERTALEEYIAEAYRKSAEVLKDLPPDLPDPE